MNLTRLDWLRAEHAEIMGHYRQAPDVGVPGYREDIGYLLQVIGNLEAQLEAQILAQLDPDNQPGRTS